MAMFVVIYIPEDISDNTETPTNVNSSEKLQENKQNGDLDKENKSTTNSNDEHKNDKIKEESDSQQNFSNPGSDDEDAGITISVADQGPDEVDLKDPTGTDTLTDNDANITEKTPLTKDSNQKQEDDEASGKQDAKSKDTKNTVKFEVSPVQEESPVNEESPLAVEEFTLVQAVQIVLEEVGIEQDVWQRADGDSYWQVSFIVEKTAQCDILLKRVTDLGIGSIQNTAISLFPANYHTGNLEQVSKLHNVPSQTDSTSEQKSKFANSMRSRLIVGQVVDSARSSSTLTFDFLVFVILASIIAAVGLAENSSVVLVASMLVSPIMGPILGGVFGFVIQRRKLWLLGVKNELISLSICIVVGLVLGLLIGGINSQGALWGSTDEWPTKEMSSRGQLRSLWVGILIALPSGAGVALSILGGNSGSLVGVAISASLLPPAVNAGMLWAYAFTSSFHPPPVHYDPGAALLPTIDPTLLVLNATDTNSTTLPPNTTSPPDTYGTFPNCARLHDNTYTFSYTCYMPHEAAILGAVSLFLTILNIVCIFIMGICVLKLKEIVPELAVSDKTRSFWKKDIKVARESYKTIKPSADNLSTSQFAKELAAEFRDTIFPNKSETGIRKSWQKIIESMEEDDQFESEKFENLGIKTRPAKFLREISEDTFHSSVSNPEERRKYNTVHGHDYERLTQGTHDLPMHPTTPATPTFDLSSPMVSPDVIHRKRALLKSPGVTREFDYDPDSRSRRNKRSSVLTHRRQPSVPHGLKFPELDLVGTEMTRSASGRFQITPVPEELPVT